LGDPPDILGGHALDLLHVEIVEIWVPRGHIGGGQARTNALHRLFAEDVIRDDLFLGFFQF